MSEENVEDFPWENRSSAPTPTVEAEPAPETPPKQEAKNLVQRTPIQLTPKGDLHPTTHSDAWRISEMLLASRALPKVFVNVAQVFMARQFLVGFNLVPEIAIRQVTIINGSLSIWGELPKALCEKSGHLEWMEEKIFDKEYAEICPENKNLNAEVWLATCEVKRKGREKTRKTWFSMEDAGKAGLLTKTGSIWKFYPRRMIQMRARSLALKDEFPEVLSGVSIAEYDHDVLVGAPIPADGTGQNNLADELNSKFLKPEETEAKNAV